MPQPDISAIGAIYRNEADRAFAKALAFAVILILAHLLEIKPSEMDAFGLKVSLTEPGLLYGSIAMAFGYYMSRSMQHSENGHSLLPINVTPHRIRANIRGVRKIWKSEAKNRRKPMDHIAIKRSAKRFIIFGNILLAPYYIASGLFVIAAIPIAAIDIYNFGEIIVERQFQEDAIPPPGEKLR